MRSVHLPAGTLVGAVIRGEQVIIPRGDTIIQVHDRVIMFALAEVVKKVEKMFAVRADYF